MSFYSPDHLLFQQSIRRFAAAEILPHLREWEDKHWFPSELFQKLGQNGSLGILIPEDRGGVGGDYILAAAWCEEFGRVPAVGLTVAVNMHSLVVLPALARFGSADAKARWISPALEGKAIGAYAFTEPGAGSDLTVVATRAVPDGDGWRLSGSKIFITNGARADFVLVLARTAQKDGKKSGGKPYDGFTTFVVDTKLPGFSVSRKLEKLGWHSSDTAELVFDNVHLSAADVLGEVGKGWYQAMQSLEWERLMLTLGAIGGATQCIEDTVRYINDRKIFGRSVGQFDANRSRLASYWSRLQTARSFAHLSIQKLQAGERCRREVSLAKLFGCELAIEIADFCLQLHGGYGYTTEFLPERWLRDLRLNTIGGGTSQVMMKIAAGEIFGHRAQEM